MSADAPHVIVLAGPNGAGKTTAAGAVLGPVLGVVEFVNADVIAQGLSGFRPEGAAVQAGRVMLARLDQLAGAGVSFAFETTLASRGFVPRINQLLARGYHFDLFFLYLSSPDLAVRRVAKRVASGGHDVPEETIRRRYRRGLDNFFRLYRPLATRWFFYEGSADEGARLVAAGRGDKTTIVADPDTWETITREFGHDPKA